MRWVFLATDNIASLTNAHHGRPVFFNLQTNPAAVAGCGDSFVALWKADIDPPAFMVEEVYLPGRPIDLREPIG